MGSMLRRLIVTRPIAQATPWVQALRAQGIDAHALPLIDIQPPADPAALQAAWQRLDRQSVVMFVSANAVQHFFAARPTGATWPVGLTAACTGPGTRAALHAAGVPEADLLSPAAGQVQESESLWALLRTRDWRGSQVLVVRGEEGRDWLAERWRTAGAKVGFVTAYRRAAPTLDALGRALLARVQAQPAGWVWHFSSAEAVDRLRVWAPWAACPQSVALATHPRIAQAARAAGFGHVSEVNPGLQAVLKALETQGCQGADTYNSARES
jgi:uroporphyrinogen-III synthase